MATRGQRSGKKAAGATPRAGAKPLPRKRPEEPPESGEKPVEATPALKLRRLQIRNYKALDELDLEIPAPRLPGEPDVLVIGSRNGVGKTSVLEACALSTLAMARNANKSILFAERLCNPLIKAGLPAAQIQAQFLRVKQQLHQDIHIRLDPVNFDGRHFRTDFVHLMGSMATVLCGNETNPLLSPPLLYFHSYRRIAQGNINLGQLLRTEGDTPGRHRLLLASPLNDFKSTVISAIMSKAGLFEDVESRDADLTMDKLNELMARFADVTIEKLRPSPENTIELRVSPIRGGQSYAFDGLSSGQKEIISTLFLIWKYTQNQPCIVLIDEPELHLNAEWHAELVGALTEIAPQNQYILATHSEQIFGSVKAERRVLITDSRER